jgi:hypothetical protein
MRSWFHGNLATLLALSLLLVSVPATAAVGPPTLASFTLHPTTVTGGAPGQVLGVTPKLGQVIGTITLSGSAPLNLRGLAISLSSNNPAVATVPAGVLVQAGATSATFNLSTNPVTSPTFVTISASYGGVTRTATLTVLPPALSSLTLNPTSVTGGAASTGTVALTGPAYSGGVTVSVSSSNLDVARVLISHLAVPMGAKVNIVTVPAGQTSATFSITTQPVASATSVTISGSYGGVTRTATLTVLPPALSSLTLNPTSVTGGAASTGTVALTGPAYSGGVTVSLSVRGPDPTIATVPAVATVPTGATTTTFTVRANPVASATSVSVEASYGGVTKHATLTVTPSVLASLTLNPSSVTGGAASTGTAIITGPAPSGGAAVSLSSNYPAVATVPAGAGVLVPAGQTSASFSITTQPVTSPTSVTISASYGGVTRTVGLTVFAPSCGGFFRLTVSPTSFTSIPTTGASVTGTVNLGDLGPAPSGGGVVKITQVAHPPTTGGPSAQLPASVMVSPGGCIATFSIKVFNCTSNYASCTNEFTAEYLGRTSSARVTLPVVQ